MIEYPVDIQYECRGKTLNWFSLDNEFRFNLNQPKDWSKDSIEYRFNNHGFRMDVEMEKISEGSNIYIGDSTTMGFGCNLEDSWAYKHHNKFHSGTFVNLSCTAGSLDTIYRLLSYWIPKIKPSNIFILEPSPNRQEFIRNDGVAITSAVWDTVEIQEIGGHEITEDVLFKDKLFKDYVSSDLQLSINKSKNLDALSKICEEYKTVFCPCPPNKREYFGEARDTFHAGPKQHEKILDWFIGVEKSSPLPSFW